MQDEPDLETALGAAMRANELTGGKHPSVLDTIARIHFQAGDLEKAVAFQTQARDAAPDISLLADTLAEYQAALAKQKAGK